MHIAVLYMMNGILKGRNVMDEQYEIAYKLFINKDYGNVKRQLEKNMNLYPDDVKNILLYAAIFLVEGNFVQGLDILEKLLSEHDDIYIVENVTELTKNLIYFEEIKMVEKFPRIMRLHKNINDDI